MAIEANIKRWEMRRNCALTPKQLFKFYIALVCLSLIVATGFFLAGVWVVLIFTVIEVAAVTIGFLIYCRHALDHEMIEINDKRVLVKKFIGQKETLYQLNAEWVRIEPPVAGSKIFILRQTDLRVELGQFIRHEEQLSLIKQIRTHLG
jgi:uncharacterized membrane protein